MATYSEADLQPCDVLLFQGTELTSQLIRLADPGPYSHAALHIGPDKDDSGTIVPFVVEMLPSGLTYRPLAGSKGESNFVDAYRYYNAAGAVIGDTDRSHVLAVADQYRAEGQHYAFDQILLLALLCSTRRISLPVAGPVLRIILDHAADLIAELLKGGKEPMICSELVYRCFTEAIPPLDLSIPGADLSIAHVAGLSDQASGAATPDDGGLAMGQSTFLQNYQIARNAAASPRSSALGAPPVGRAVADFVTPNDLGRSPNLQKLGTLG